MFVLHIYNIHTFIVITYKINCLQEIHYIVSIHNIQVLYKLKYSQFSFKVLHFGFINLYIQYVYCILLIYTSVLSEKFCNVSIFYLFEYFQNYIINVYSDGLKQITKLNFIFRKFVGFDREIL